MKIKKISGNHKEVMENCGEFDLQFPKMQPKNKTILIDGLLIDSSYPSALAQIWKDLNRVFFLLSDNKTFADLISSWTHDLHYTAYVQGDMDGRVHTVLRHYIQLNPKFVEQHFDCTKENNRHLELYFANIKNISFAYFDDNGTPCAIDIAYSPDDTSLWTFTQVKNTTSSAEKKEVTLMAPEQLIYHPANTELVYTNSPISLLNVKQTQSQFIALLNSVENESKFLDILNNDGQVNLVYLTQLKELLIHAWKDGTVQRGKSKFNKIYNGFIAHSGQDWDKPSIDETNENFKNYLQTSLLNQPSKNDEIKHLAELLTDFIIFENKKTNKLTLFFKQNSSELIIGWLTFLFVVICLILIVTSLLPLLPGILLTVTAMVIGVLDTVLIASHKANNTLNILQDKNGAKPVLKSKLEQPEITENTTDSEDQNHFHSPQFSDI